MIILKSSQPCKRVCKGVESLGVKVKYGRTLSQLIHVIKSGTLLFHAISSDEVETLYVLPKVVVRNRDASLGWSFGSITDQIGESVGVLNRCWNFDGACNVIVGIAQLVGQRLDLSWVSSC